MLIQINATESSMCKKIDLCCADVQTISKLNEFTRT